MPRKAGDYMMYQTITDCLDDSVKSAQTLKNQGFERFLQPWRRWAASLLQPWREGPQAFDKSINQKMTVPIAAYQRGLSPSRNIPWHNIIVLGTNHKQLACTGD